MILEAYHYNFTCLQNIPLLTPLTHLFEFLDQIALSFLRARHSHSCPGACSAAPRSCAPASQHLARRPTTAAVPARQPCASHCSPVHHHGASATCRHVGLPLDGALQLVPAARRRSTEPRTFQQRTLSSSLQQQARERSNRIHGCAGREAGARAAVVQPEHLWAHRGALSASSTTLLWPRHGRRR